MSAKKQKIDNTVVPNSCLTTELVTDLINFEDQANLRWKVYGFKDLFKPSHNNIRVNSAKFLMSENTNIACKICIFPKGAEIGSNYKNWISYKLEVDTHPFEVVTSTLSIQMSIFVGTADENNTHKILEKECFIGKEVYEKMMREELYLKAAKEHSMNDLTLVCSVKGEFTVTAATVKHKPKNNKLGCPVRGKFNKVLVKPIMPPSYEKLLSDASFSDISIHVGDKIIKAHKNILAVSSPVFSAMFQNEWREKQDNNLIIADSSYEVIQNMLRYMYTGTVQNKNIFDRLFVVAHKYDIKELMRFCELELEKSVHHNTAWSLLVLADKYSIKSLKVKVMNFIASNKKTMLMQPQYKDVLTNNPALIADFFTYEVQ